MNKKRILIIILLGIVTITITPLTAVQATHENKHITFDVRVTDAVPDYEYNIHVGIPNVVGASDGVALNPIDSKDGIYLKSGSSNNKIYNNNVTDAMSNAILVNVGSSKNMFYSNTIINASSDGYGINVKDPSTSVDNKFENNYLINSRERTD